MCYGGYGGICRIWRIWRDMEGYVGIWRDMYM